MMAETNLESLIKKRSILIEQIRSMSQAMDKILDEDESSELERLIVKENELLDLYGAMTDKINDLFQQGQTGNEHQIKHLQEQESQWKDFLGNRNKMIQKARNKIQTISRESKKLDTTSRVRGAYAHPPTVDRKKSLESL
ncbi:MAG: hypothetical protein JW774_04450 [Candidatus Aureabacteria bacterium]|nr:hypothetical protein [Candidatus Auribacterota bacterium]